MKKVTESMLADILWIQETLGSMGKDFDKRITADTLHRSKEFCIGALYERQRISDELYKSFNPDLTGSEQK
jgi:hypothetical protein